MRHVCLVAKAKTQCHVAFAIRTDPAFESEMRRDGHFDADGFRAGRQTFFHTDMYDSGYGPTRWLRWPFPRRRTGYLQARQIDPQ